MHLDYPAYDEAERLVQDFLGHVSAPPHDLLDVFISLMTDDYSITSGKVVRGKRPSWPRPLPFTTSRPMPQTVF